MWLWQALWQEQGQQSEFAFSWWLKQKQVIALSGGSVAVGGCCLSWYLVAGTAYSGGFLG